MRDTCLFGSRCAGVSVMTQAQDAGASVSLVSQDFCWPVMRVELKKYTFQGLRINLSPYASLSFIINTKVKQEISSIRYIYKYWNIVWVPDLLCCGWSFVFAYGSWDVLLFHSAVLILGVHLYCERSADSQGNLGRSSVLRQTICAWEQPSQWRLGNKARFSLTAV